MSTPHGILLVPGGDAWIAVALDGRGEEVGRDAIPSEELEAWIAEAEAEAQGPVRWVLRGAQLDYRALLDRGVRLTRAHDLLLCHAILRDTDAVDAPLAFSERWMRTDPAAEARQQALFDVVDAEESLGVDEALAQYRAQQRVLAADASGRLTLLCAAESAGGLIAEEMRAAGVPWDAAVHDRILVGLLGERRPGSGMPARMAAAADEVRTILGDPQLHLDSHPRLLRALHRVGVNVESTSQWELGEVEHPVIAPLLAYKKMSRLMSANGWAWLDEWVSDGRFRPVYIPGGVVTGRWASAGGGALQLPRALRPAVRADEGWTLIVADVAQLEPRMLAAMSGDEAMADAARGADLYEGVVASGAVATREEAKYAVLGAMYGATTGDSGRLVPRLRRVYPRAMHVVDDAARTGEAGGVVSTLLGRSSPRPGADWNALQAQAADADGPVARRARSRIRDRGRFTRNFVVQGTAAEWALIWLAEIRHGLKALPEARVHAPASGPFARRAHLAFFLHDEVILHVPAEQGEDAAQIVRNAAATATRRLFGGFPIDVPLDLRIAKGADK